ncbi:hypothetical protein GE300_10765 [Rhodobacteraceae bacterium 2CG4]|uniref:Uncharacterized protein n=1 Tax=Halovulum marinum TaxID=2662447 RepID=A0A6L5Z0N0_9RHOB|nr:hypothetical protein [Halovulum marinum]
MRRGWPGSTARAEARARARAQAAGRTAPAPPPPPARPGSPAPRRRTRRRPAARSAPAGRAAAGPPPAAPRAGPANGRSGPPGGGASLHTLADRIAAFDRAHGTAPCTRAPPAFMQDMLSRNPDAFAGDPDVQALMRHYPGRF